jgi:radical SAM superfamily enzyme YgiQ (UPF0313 family)
LGNKANALNILLVYPRYPDTFWSFNHALKFISKNSFAPPLGLLTIAALLPKTWKQKLVDLNVGPLKDEDIHWADYIFLSAMDVQQASAKEVIARGKAQGKKVVAGGPLFTMSPDRFPEVDHIILREAEDILHTLIQDLVEGKAEPIYTPKDWPDMTLSPIPAWGLVDMSKYASMCIQYIRGCPFDCDFCAISLLNGKQPRMKSETQFLSELEALYQNGWRGAIFIGDDNFTVNPCRLKEKLLPLLIEWMEEKNYPFFFFTQASLNLIGDEELIRLMVRAGFDSVFLGIETLETESLNECNKTQNLNWDLLAGIKRMQRLGLMVTGGFILGFDNDSPGTFQKQIDFIQKSGIVGAMVGLLNAERGTKLYQRLQKENRLAAETTGDNTNFSINFIPKMGIQQLMEGYKHIVSFIYSPQHFYERLITFLKNYNLPERARQPLTLSDTQAFFRAIWTIGIRGEGRLYYWKTMLWTILRCRDLLPMYLRLAIYGYHFRKVFQKEG